MRREHHRPLPFLCLLLASAALAQQPVPVLRPAATADAPTAPQAPVPWAAAVQAAIEQQVAADQIPGLSCAIGVGSAIPFARGFGLADVENDVPATAATVYRLASISKPITAVAAMQLVEAGKLDLDRDVHEVLPAWPEKPWPVTTRQLLGHLGGVRHYRPGETESTFHYATQTDALARFASDPLLHEPGTAYHYSTYGFNLVAAVVEQAGGLPFAQFVHERIALPSGAVTLQDDDVRRLIRGRAQGYLRVGKELQNSELLDGSYKLGGGGLCCSAPDLVRFAQALVQGKLLKPASVAVLWTPQQPRPGQPGENKPSDYGCGFRIDQTAGRRVVSHSGAQSRVSTMLYLLPDAQVTVVLLCNLEKVRLQPLAQRIAALVAPVKTTEKRE